MREGSRTFLGVGSWNGGGPSGSLQHTLILYLPHPDPRVVHFIVLVDYWWEVHLTRPGPFPPLQPFHLKLLGPSDSLRVLGSVTLISMSGSWSSSVPVQGLSSVDSLTSKIVDFRGTKSPRSSWNDLETLGSKDSRGRHVSGTKIR